MNDSYEPTNNLNTQDFNLQNPEENIVSIRLRSDGLCFSILNKTSGSVERLEMIGSADGNIPGLISTLPEKYPGIEKVKDIRVLIVNHKATFIPYALFDEDESKHYLSFNVDIEAEEEVLYQKLEYLKSYCIYAVPGKIKYQVEKVFPQAKFEHFAGRFTDSVLKTADENGKNVILHVNVQKDSFFAGLTNGKELLFYNVFTFSNPDEFIYYILNVIHQRKLKTSKVDVLLYGDIKMQSTLYREISDNFNEVKLASPKFDFKLRGNALDLPKHSYFTLLEMFS